MIGYTTFGSNNLGRSAAFYDDLLSILGAKRFMESDTFIAWAVSPGQPAVSICKPFDGKKATVGNGTMVALAADSKDLVDSVYARAIELGGSDEGPPGARTDGFYAAYFRDLDGNKLNVFYFEAKAE